MLYTLCEHEIAYLGLTNVSIDDIMNDEHELQIVASLIIENLITHMLPNMMSLQMPLNVKAHRTTATEFELFMQFIYPLEVLDYEEGYDEFIDLSENNMESDFSHAKQSFVEKVDTHDDLKYVDDINEEEIVILSFKRLDDVIQYAKCISFIKDKPNTILYKFKNEYHLLCDFMYVEEVIDIIRCEHVATEHNCTARYDILFKSLLEEHGKCIIASNAIDILLAI